VASLIGAAAPLLFLHSRPRHVLWY